MARAKWPKQQAEEPLFAIRFSLTVQDLFWRRVKGEQRRAIANLARPPVQ